MRHLIVVSALALVLAAPAAAGSLPLVGYWPMFEGQGQVVHDLSGMGNNGVLGASTAVESSDPSWIRGGLFGALHFGGNQYVTVPDSPALAPARVTVLGLVRGSSSPGQWRYVFSKGSLGCVNGSYGLYSGFGGGLAFYVANGENSFVVSPEAPVSIWNGKWHVVAGSFDGSTVRLFVDGAEIGTGTTVSLPFSIAYGLPSGQSMIGQYNGGCDLSFTGDIDEVSVWSAALPMSQILPKAQALLASALR
jgi:Concanavalin A-like lectin/glucanases superfamily